MRPRALTGTALAVAIALTSAAETYRDIEVAPERRCAPYDRGDYRYSQSLEPRIVASLGKVYGPYTGTCFQTSRSHFRGIQPHLPARRGFSYLGSHLLSIR